MGFDNLKILVWTTTPWTLISNVALAVSENANYVVIKIEGEILIIAEERLKIIQEEYSILKTVKGSDLFGLKYEQLLSYVKPNANKRVFEIIVADFVTMDDGTGIVHMAPAFGEDDYQQAQKYNLDLLQPVNPNGTFQEAVTDFKGLFVKKADPKIIKKLKEQNKLYKSELYKHSYPFCWRCDTPLLYYARSSWFVKVTEIKDKLLANNQKINWIPAHIKEGRFGNFLENIIDWGLSRERYWGTPLNIWQCENCSNEISIGSIEDLRNKGENVPENIDLHRPTVDKITIKCDHCGSTMKRVSEVIDCWFDSGMMHTAQWHYPFEHKQWVENGTWFPADYIVEAIDQTRGWFYTLLAVATLLGKGAPYKNVISLGHILDEKGEKMSP